MAEAPEFIALQLLIDHCRKGTLYDDWEQAVNVVGDAQIALLKLYEEAGRPLLPPETEAEAVLARYRATVQPIDGGDRG